MTIDSSAEAKRAYLLDALKGYWPYSDAPVRSLHIPYAVPEQGVSLPPRVELVELPPWAADVGVAGTLLVPTACITCGDGPAWQRTDWFTAAFYMLNGVWEREFEARHGPIHSYSIRLPGWDPRLWERAWVNRIALFLRRWAAHSQGGDEMALCGPRPRARILLTHDVDAVAKTLAIRLKQGAFAAFNAVRGLLAGRWVEATRQTGKCLRFLVGPGRYDYLAEVGELERERGLTSTFHFYAGCRRGPEAWLFDPSYDPAPLAARPEVAALVGNGFRIGLHPSFGSWRSAAMLRQERQYLEQSFGMPVQPCRQHWLRFSWQDTWVAQAEAGLTLDATLGFNDRPAFRNSAALCWQPWTPEREVAGPMQAVPLLFMDSHFYDYLRLSDAARRLAMQVWVDEVKAVGGTATVLWHPHTLADDYGWRGGFVELLDLLDEDL